MNFSNLRCTLPLTTITYFYSLHVVYKPHFLPCQVNIMIELETIWILIQCFSCGDQRFQTTSMFLSLRIKQKSIDLENSHNIWLGIKQNCKSHWISLRDNGNRLLAFMKLTLCWKIGCILTICHLVLGEHILKC